MRVRLAKPDDHYIGSREGVTDVWRTGEVRELAEEVGRYLLDTFGDRFAEHVDPPAPEEAPPVAAVVEKPARTSAVPGARSRER